MEVGRARACWACWRRACHWSRGLSAEGAVVGALGGEDALMVSEEESNDVASMMLTAAGFTNLARLGMWVTPLAITSWLLLCCRRSFIEDWSAVSRSHVLL